MKYYLRRQTRAIYPNHARVIVDTYASQLFKEGVPRNVKGGSGGDYLVDFWNDIDLAGTSADDFYEAVAQRAQIYGFMAVVVDRHEPGSGTPQTRADELDSGRRPYAYAVEPQDILDWRVDSRGRIEWIMIRETVPYERSFDEPYGELKYRYRMWTRSEWRLYEVETVEEDEGTTSLNYRLVDEGTHPLGRVPVEFVFFSKRKAPNPVGESLIKDIAPLTRRLMNLISLIDEQIYQHVFNIMVVPESTWEELEKVDFSVAGSIPVKDDASHVPFYLSPDVGQIEVIQRQIEATEQSIRFLSGLGRQNEQSQTTPSGVALAYQTTDKRALVGKFAQSLEDLEARVDEAALAWMEIPYDAENVARTYDIKLEPGEVDQALGDALKFESLGITGEAAVENQVQAARAYLGKLVTPERLQEIIDDIRTSKPAAAYMPPFT
ncbi:MAG: phage portal protein [Phycisphaerales bacterium JB052]